MYRTAFLLFALLLWPSVTYGQQQTIWVGENGDWFDQGAWTNGVPTTRVFASIPMGEVFVSGDDGGQAFALDVARTDNEFAQATLLIEQGSLLAPAQVTIAETQETGAAGALTILGSGPDGSLITDELRIGIVNGVGGEADGLVELVGDLRPGTKAGGKLLIGQNNGQGFAIGRLITEGVVRNETFGIGEIIVGHANGGVGQAIGELNVTAIQYAGGQLTVGLNTSNALDSTATGFLTANEITGVAKAFFGQSERGASFATAHVTSTFEAIETVVGSANGRGRARFHLGDEAKFTGQILTVHRGSSVSFGDQLNAQWINAGRGLVTNRPDGSPGGTVLMTNVVEQTSTGVLELDVAGPFRGESYEAIDILDGGSLQGVLRINFMDTYQPKEGEQFEFIKSEGPLNLRGLEWQVTNPPQGLAIEFEQSDNLAFARFVKPAARDFLNPGGNAFSWADRSIWSDQRPPSSIDDVALVNKRGLRQTITAIPGATSRNLTIDGLGSEMLVHVPLGASLTATHGIHVRSLGGMTLEDGKILTDQLQLDAEATFRGQGSIGGDVLNQGLLGVGLDTKPSTLQIDGDLELLSQSWLEMDILGTKEGQFDQIVVDGSIQLAGTLNLNLVDRDAIGPNAQIPLLLASEGILGNLTIRFDNPIGEIPLGLRSFSDPESGDTTIMLISGPGPGILGDMNWDSCVDEKDLGPFALGLQNVDAYTDDFVFEPSHIGDISNDGTYDVDDIDPFFTLVENSTCEVEAIPEPHSGLLFLVMALCLLTLRQRKGI